jgi:hypothetical protein
VSNVDAATVDEVEAVEIVEDDDHGDDPRTLSAREDPRAMAGIRRGKGLGGLAGFAIAALAAHMHGELMASVLLRALAGGMAGYMLGWLAAVTVWRRIIRAELHHTIQMVAKARTPAPQGDAQ